MNTLQAIVLGIVEGVTEYLPVSSTGHLILTAAAMGLGAQDGAAGDAAQLKAAVDRFSIIIQGGAILAVAVLYWPRVRQILRGGVSLVRPGVRDAQASMGVHLILLLAAGFVPAAIVGVLAGKWIKANLFGPLPVIGALVVGGILMIVIAPWHRSRLRAFGGSSGGVSHADALRGLSWRGALFIGCVQTLALWPGTSRSLVTLLAGMLIGLPPVAAAEFAFLLGLPTLGAASAKDLLEGLREMGAAEFLAALGGPMPVLAGSLAAMASAAVSVKWLVRYLGRHTLELFGWWRIIVAGAFAWAIAMGWIAR
ncbi:MAG: undecaprenyl-diphosphate phosphatase [Planctomycetes bacterium]|nr:undecaprenyl-diphosphate phosphatase [Planctomycetota bacterium]